MGISFYLGMFQVQEQEQDDLFTGFGVPPQTIVVTLRECCMNMAL